jgi:hypothetical protein
LKLGIDGMRPLAVRCTGCWGLKASIVIVQTGRVLCVALCC